MLLKLDQLRLDGGTQPRAVLNQDVINEYADLMRSGVVFPPVTVFFDGNDYWLADGFHRVGAARQVASFGSIEVDVHQGTLQDAQWFSYSVNKSHGLRRSNEDKLRAVRAALVHPKTIRENLGNVQIADHCGVSEFMVRKYRPSPSSIKPKMDAEPAAPGGPSAVDSATRTVTRGGTTYRQNTAKIGKSPGTSANRRHKWGGVSPNALKPVRGYSKPFPMTAMNVPHDPKAAARGLVALFDKPFLSALVEELTQILKGESQ